MEKLKDFLLIKAGPNPNKLSPRLKFIGLMEMFTAIIIGGYFVLKGIAGTTTLVVPGLLFLIGIATSYTGSLFGELSALESRLGVKRND